jgi:rubrerythrin
MLTMVMIMDINEAMKIALDNEEKSVKLYNDASGKTENGFVKDTFEYLAKQEEKTYF